VYTEAKDHLDYQQAADGNLDLTFQGNDAAAAPYRQAGLLPAPGATLDKRQVGEAGKSQTFGCLSGAGSAPASEKDGFLMSRGGASEPPCYILRTQFTHGEQLRTWYVAVAVFSCRTHIENCRPFPAQLHGVQLLGPDGRYLCFHVLLLNPRERDGASRCA
jgi:hypothetical protein